MRNCGKQHIIPQERKKAELLFEKILKDPEACRRLTETFYESMDADTDIECGYLPPEKLLMHCWTHIKP